MQKKIVTMTLTSILLLIAITGFIMVPISVKASGPPFTYPVAYIRWYGNGIGYWTMIDDLVALAAKYGLSYTQLVDEYTESNIDDLWAKLSTYKCILVDEDAIYQYPGWGSIEIKTSFANHKTELSTWIEAGHGIWFGDDNNYYNDMVWDWLPTPIDQVRSNGWAGSDPYTGCILQDPTYRLWTFPNTIDQAWLNSMFKDCHGAFYEDSFPSGVPAVVLVRAPVSQSYINMVQGDAKEILFWLGGGVIGLSHMELEISLVPEYVENEICFLQQPPVPPFSIDIKPSSWPNPINTGSKGLFAVAICGTKEFDVKTIDPATVKIFIEGISGGVALMRWSYGDVATPYTGPIGGGHALGGDGYLDLVLHFDTQTVVTTLGLITYVRQTIPLIIKGNLKPAFDGTLMQGTDYVLILK